MAVVKCICKDKKCDKRILFDHASKALIIKHGGHEVLFSMDANACVATIKELRRMIKGMAEEEDI